MSEFSEEMEDDIGWSNINQPTKAKKPILKHICIRHEGMVTIIPDVIAFDTDVVDNHTVVWIERIGQRYITFKDVEEISSPYSQQE